MSSFLQDEVCKEMGRQAPHIDFYMKIIYDIDSTS